jgi:Spy/CpxP family protein refolding chaperone
MKILNHWKVIFAVVLVFAAGGVVGSALTVVHFKHAFERGFTVENWTAEAMKVLQKELKLTPEQQPRIKAILVETGGKFKTSFGRAICESGTNMVSSWHQIDQELTPEQRVIHQRKCDEFRQKLKNKLKIELPPE